MMKIKKHLSNLAGGFLKRRLTYALSTVLLALAFVSGDCPNGQEIALSISKLTINGNEVDLKNLQTQPDIPISPTIVATFSQAVTQVELEGKFTLTPEAGGDNIGISITAGNDNSFTVTLADGASLSKNTTYILAFKKGLSATIDGVTYSLAQDVSVKFTTQNTHTVTFDAKGGSEVAAITLGDGETLTLPANPARENYGFGGWFKDEALTQAFSATETITADLTLYAKWTLNSFTVTFDSKGGSSVEAVPVNLGLTLAAPTAPTREGYTFEGWYKDENLATTFAFDSETVTSDLTLYAKWTLNTYTVTFNSNGGTSVEAKTVDHGEKLTLPTAPTLTGAAFEGWYKDDDLTMSFDDKIETITADLTLYAKWEGAKITATFPYVGYFDAIVEISSSVNVAIGAIVSSSATAPEKSTIDTKLGYLSRHVTTAKMALLLTTLVSSSSNDVWALADDGLKANTQYYLHIYYTDPLNGASTETKSFTTLPLETANPSESSVSDGFITATNFIFYNHNDAVIEDSKSSKPITVSPNDPLVLYATSKDVALDIVFNATGNSAGSCFGNNGGCGSIIAGVTLGQVRHNSTNVHTMYYYHNAIVDSTDFLNVSLEQSESSFSYDATLTDFYFTPAQDFDPSNGSLLVTFTPDVAFTTFNGATFSNADNPSVSSSNETQRVGKVVNSGGAWQGIALELAGKIDFSTKTKIEFLVYSPVAGTDNILVKLEDKTDGNTNTEVRVSTTQANAWEKVTATFATGDSNKYDKLVIFVGTDASGNTVADQTFYIDNIRLVP